MLRVQELVQLLEVGRRRVRGGDGEAAADDRQLAPLALGDPLPRSGRQRLRLGRAEGVEERRDRHVAPLDLLRRDRLQKPAEAAVAHARRDRDRVGTELLQDDLLHRP
ncbi:MAG: hypothetical protein E6J77_24195, partial [Deltaproteobacteria bacterium]